MTDSPGLRASSAFTLLAIAFGLIFTIVVAIVWIDQTGVIDSARKLQTETMPKIARFQRTGIKLEQLRQEGERVFAANTEQARQQALMAATLLASDPAMVATPEAGKLASEAISFLNEVAKLAQRNPGALAAKYNDWLTLTERLDQQVDHFSEQSIDLADADLGTLTDGMRLVRYKLYGALLIVGLFLALFLLLVLRHLVQPLKRIDRTLSGLCVEHPPPPTQDFAMQEIQAVQQAIGELHASLIENEAARKSLENLANKDGLTGLTNRRRFMLLAETELERAQRYHRPISVGMADIDFFKKLNDGYGHAAGDAVLRSMAELIREILRQSDLVGRYGGEEFAFLFPESALPEAAKLAERLRVACAEHEFELPDGQQVRVTLSLGIADAGHGTLDTVLRRADNALYKAKAQGRNCIVVDDQQA